MSHLCRHKLQMDGLTLSTYERFSLMFSRGKLGVPISFPIWNESYLAFESSFGETKTTDGSRAKFPGSYPDDSICDSHLGGGDKVWNSKLLSCQLDHKRLRYGVVFLKLRLAALTPDWENTLACQIHPPKFLVAFTVSLNATLSWCYPTIWPHSGSFS